MHTTPVRTEGRPSGWVSRDSNVFYFVHTTTPRDDLRARAAVLQVLLADRGRMLCCVQVDFDRCHDKLSRAKKMITFLDDVDFWNLKRRDSRGLACNRAIYFACTRLVTRAEPVVVSVIMVAECFGEHGMTPMRALL